MSLMDQTKTMMITMGVLREPKGSGRTKTTRWGGDLDNSLY
jgi:hypothetical protein